MRDPRITRALGAALSLAALGACSSSKGGGGGAWSASTTAPATNATSATATVSSGTTSPVTSASQAVPAPDDGTVPVIVLHGFGGSPQGLWDLLDRIGTGRPVVQQMYDDDALALQPGDLPPDVVVDFGYYQASQASTKYDPDAQGLSHGSIGACPVPRSDGLGSYYTTSYAVRLQHCVEGVLRATGKQKVDLVGHSMGGLVVRAYTKWLSVDATGFTPVRRILMFGSPSRGINALDALLLDGEQSGVTDFMREGEIVEMCREAPIYGGESYTEILNDGWDTFCSQHGILYGGLAGKGAYGPQPPLVTPAEVQSVVANLNPAIDVAIAAIVAIFWSDVSAEVQETLGPGDGEVPLPVARLDQAPFTGAALAPLVEARHTFYGDDERSLDCSTLSAEALRAFTLASGTISRSAVCSSLSLAPVSVPGAATWLRASVTVQGACPLEAQLVEETLDVSGVPSTAMGYGQVLRPGTQELAFIVPAGGGTRSYHLVVYGAQGSIASIESVTFALQDGALEAAPQAQIASVSSSTTPLGPAVHATFTSNAAPSDPALAYRVRFDHGPWSSPRSAPTFDTPPLGQGLHRIEVVATSSSNAAQLVVDGTVPDAADVLVDPSGNAVVTH